ncbi:MAG TPA: Fic family protein [Vineibacter sp.]|nr:Fic family protein [Vineibacter sp.]
MVRRIQEAGLRAIEVAVRRQPDGVTAQLIADALETAPPLRTLQYHLKHLVDHRRLVRQGGGRGARYHAPRHAVRGFAAPEPSDFIASNDAAAPWPSPAGAEVQAYVRRPVAVRKPVGYNFAFLDSYRPNRTFYLTAAQRAHLRTMGTPQMPQQPAGTHARQILNRLLIDLSWNSSRLEGNTYSLLETKRLIELGEATEGRQRFEAQMILNHKDAIEFLVDNADEIGFTRPIVLNLHTLLANSLLDDPDAEGRLRRIAVGISGSVFDPLQAPPLIAEYFDQILATAAAIADPFEQALFVMVQLPYLQPFEDVNKRVSRLAANVPLIKANLAPLSFDGVTRQAYTSAILGVYELNRTELLRDVFIWAYERSAVRYASVRQTLGEPDPFKMRHRLALRELVAAVVHARMTQRQAAAHVGAWTEANIDAAERERFREIVERDLLGLHEGNYARHKLRLSEFAAWREVWGG